MEKGQLSQKFTHVFRIAIRGPHAEIMDDGGMNPGSTHLQLGEKGGSLTSYFYTPYWNKLKINYGPGCVRRPMRQIKEDISIEFSITVEKYRSLKDQLQQLSTKGPHGIYALPVSNCVSFAVNFARANGFDVPKPFLPTPRGISSALRKRAEQGQEGIEIRKLRKLGM